MLITEKQAREILPMSLSWFQRSRWSGSGGPRFKKIGRRVFYDKDELLDWIESHQSVKSSTEAEEAKRKEEA